LLEVVLLQVLDAHEKPLLRFGDATLRLQLDARQFKRAEQVCRLKEAVSPRQDLRHELDLREEQSECVLEKPLDLGLSVVIVDLQPIVDVERATVVEEECGHLAQQFNADCVRLRDKPLIDNEARVGNVEVTDKGEHPGENAAAVFSRERGVVLFAANERSGMDAVVARKSEFDEVAFEFAHGGRNRDVLVMEQEADDVIARRRDACVETP